jgi:hypothetical protein
VKEVHPEIKTEEPGDSDEVLMPDLHRMLLHLCYGKYFVYREPDVLLLGVVAGSFIGPFLWGLYSKELPSWRMGGMLPYYYRWRLYHCLHLYSRFDAAKSMAPVFGVSAMAASVVRNAGGYAFSAKIQ